MIIFLEVFQMCRLYTLRLWVYSCWRTYNILGCVIVRCPPPMPSMAPDHAMDRAWAAEPVHTISV